MPERARLGPDRRVHATRARRHARPRRLAQMSSPQLRTARPHALSRSRLARLRGAVRRAAPARARSRRPELEAFVSELAERPELWIDLVQHDATQRVYEELLRRRAPDRLADLLDGRPRHRLSRPRRLRRGRRRRQRRRARGAAGDRRPAAQERLPRRARASTSPPRTSTACATPAATRPSRCTSTRRRCCGWAPT